MSAPADAEQHKQAVRDVFESVATGYDNPATRFFPFCAERLTDFVRPRPGSRVLDVATGSGAVAIPLAQAVGPQGRVHGIDISAAMLAQAEANARKMGLNNIDLHEMDAERLDFKADHFHHVVCSYGLFFLPDMAGALNEWARVLRPGGTLAFTCFEESAFEPMLEHFLQTLQAFGVTLPPGPIGAKRITSLHHCRELLAGAGLEQIQTQVAQMGYHLADENAWWEAIANTAMQGWLRQVEPARLDELRRAHLDHVASLKTADGLWMDVQTRFARGVKPAT